jgi:hypothetical protein
MRPGNAARRARPVRPPLPTDIVSNSARRTISNLEQGMRMANSEQIRITALSAEGEKRYHHA